MPEPTRPLRPFERSQEKALRQLRETHYPPTNAMEGVMSMAHLLRDLQDEIGPNGMFGNAETGAAGLAVLAALAQRYAEDLGLFRSYCPANVEPPFTVYEAAEALAEPQS